MVTTVTPTGVGIGAVVGLGDGESGDAILAGPMLAGSATKPAFAALIMSAAYREKFVSH